MNIPDKAVEAAARAHYVYVWHSVDCDAEAAAARWDGGEVEGDVMAYHGDHVRHQIQAAAPFIAAQALDDLEAHLRAGLAAARNGGEQHLHEDALIMLDAYRGNQ